MMRLFALLALAMIVGCAGDVHAACSHKGQSCRVDADCCSDEGLICDNGCRAGTLVRLRGAGQG